MNQDVPMLDSKAPADAVEHNATTSNRGLPGHVLSKLPPGLIPANPRSPREQEAFDYRKQVILQTMTANQIEEAYWETVAKIDSLVEDDRKKNDDVDREIKKLEDQRQLERKLFHRQKEERAGRDTKTETSSVVKTEVDMEL